MPSGHKKYKLEYVHPEYYIREARKEFKCSKCGNDILVGDKYWFKNVSKKSNNKARICMECLV